MAEGKILRSFLSNFGLMLIQPDKQLRSASAAIKSLFYLCGMSLLLRNGSKKKKVQLKPQPPSERGFEENSAPRAEEKNSRGGFVIRSAEG